MILFLKMCSLAIRRRLLHPGDDNTRALTIVLVSRDEGLDFPGHAQSSLGNDNNLSDISKEDKWLIAKVVNYAG